LLDFDLFPLCSLSPNGRPLLSCSISLFLPLLFFSLFLPHSWGFLSASPGGASIVLARPAGVVFFTGAKTGLFHIFISVSRSLFHVIFRGTLLIIFVPAAFTSSLYGEFSSPRPYFFSPRPPPPCRLKPSDEDHTSRWLAPSALFLKTCPSFGAISFEKKLAAVAIRPFFVQTTCPCCLDSFLNRLSSLGCFQFPCFLLPSLFHFQCPKHSTISRVSPPDFFLTLFLQNLMSPPFLFSFPHCLCLISTHDSRCSSAPFPQTGF